MIKDINNFKTATLTLRWASPDPRVPWAGPEVLQIRNVCVECGVGDMCWPPCAETQTLAGKYRLADDGQHGGLWGRVDLRQIGEGLSWGRVDIGQIGLEKGMGSAWLI